MRAVKSYGGSAITVFGIAFDIYTGTPIEKAIFIGIGGALGGAGAASLLVGAFSGPPGWATVAVAGAGSALGGGAAGLAWDNFVPGEVKDWFDEQRREAREINKEKDDSRLWNEYYDDERDDPIPRDIDLKGP